MRIIVEMKRIRKSGMDLHTTPVSDLLAAGVVLSNELYLTRSTLVQLSTKFL